MFDGKEAVIFDLDGTLIDSMYIWDKIDQEIIEARGHKFPDDFFDVISNMRAVQIYDYIAKKYGRPGETGDDIRRELQQLVTHKIVNVCKEKPHSWDFVRFCAKKGLKLGIASNNEKQTILKLLEKQGVKELFSTVRTSADVPRSKPYPDIYLLAAKDLGVLPAKCLVFEDLPAGISAGKSAGMTVCAVQDSFSDDYDDLKRQLADYYTSSYEDVMNGKYETLK